MSKKIYIVDSFITSDPFSGNPAGVCILNKPKSSEWMQDVAAEMNHSETAFLLKKDKGFAIWYFTPTTEVPLCGHATLAAAHILYEEEMTFKNEIIFYAAGGTLKAEKNNGYITLNFPAPKIQHKTSIDDQELKQINVSPISIYQSENTIIIELQSEDHVKQYVPDFNALSVLPYHLIILTAQATGYHFVSRVFAPKVGINEDPATGIAQCMLGMIWATKHNNTTLEAYQASSRGGLFTIQVNQKQERITLAGKSKIVLKGTLWV